MSYISDIRKFVNHAPIFMPASAAIIVKYDKILLQQRSDNLKWGLHGGSMELGETLEETLIREVKEETNLDILSYCFFKNYSGKDFKITYPNGDVCYVIDHIYVVDQYKGDLKPQKNEVKTLQWFSFDEIPWDDLMHHNKIILKDFMKSLGK
ncbi:NUDIX hydrolase [Acholeplasma hippikon]|uniref:NTP pyrophosphohydrolases containing a Zn-finger, probably nucleic-acid-binding n=1 Tax=Acholeplasma hippikon TaxID=264636 RepID=A0A449BJU7_9MOLU|nr:NUDIX hydrolase [Acholeplasma hippikon]VEU82663.1 NTP pyrophosphohydrolases containing a Zn-finger, probably nucleic-acid-binding [Acholeplasma hippikon]